VTTFGLSRGWLRDSLQTSDADPGSPLLSLGPEAFVTKSRLIAGFWSR
jgi:hypothetical protein